ncbi:hypothetical protein CAPTEDRAFT_156226 [Capitella teleta]|uniref:Oxysterol-binding protein n=1 Tax=Capitella teleta TaxID=283909 RepID=R7UW01_CAPTE|nr:hypothetical protein CAPTEDRAFT_156226 [Capitella teleta]|eukprot:ELU10803.1 hypothetical protein CAPTEDRAFT_156226 [Capitella teleta]
MGWSPLHLASYFGHAEVVKILLQNEADVNMVNANGDTALHKAAFTSRLDVVTQLLQNNADVDIINAEGFAPKHLCRNSEIKDLLEAVENCQQRKLEEEFLLVSTEGMIDAMKDILSKDCLININCVDCHGNTALHCASYRGQREVAVHLLQNGIDTTIKNKKGQTALEMAREEKMKQILDVKPIKELRKLAPRFEGPLLRRSKILGWRPVWVVLERGVLSVFINRADSTTGSRRKASKYLNSAKIQTKSDSPSNFIIKFNDSSAMTFSFQENSTASFSKWENALTEHIGYSTRMSNDMKVSDDEAEEVLPLGSLQESLQTSQAHQGLLERHVATVTKSIQDLTSRGKTSINEVTLVNLQQQLTQITSLSGQMCQSMSHCLDAFTQQQEVQRLQLQKESEKCRVLEDALHVLAQEQYHLEKSLQLQGHRSPTPKGTMYDSDPEEFYDCEEEEEGEEEEGRTASCKTSASEQSLASRNGVQPSSSWGGRYGGYSPLRLNLPFFNFRCHLPKPMISRHDFSVWSILKQCIGKELSKITMPVIFNEPLSFVQRIVEYMEYANLLKLADQCDDPVQRLEYVTAFAVSATASNWDRIGKPFNPLLGETYQLERDDLGFRIYCEQVSHHPPVSAFHVDSPIYEFSGSVLPKLKFWGKSVEVTPKGIVTLHLKRHNETFSWQNVNCCVHNIIVGKIWVEHYGGMEVMNHSTKQKASLHFKPSGWFGKDLHKVEGCILDQNKKKLRSFYGKWVEAIYSCDPESLDIQTSHHADESYQPPEDSPQKGSSSCDLGIPGQRLLWSALPRPVDSEEYYAFTLFAMMLNELPDSLRSQLAPTDSRLRPDIRRMEEGDIDGAAIEKNRLEEKQRAVRKERKKSKSEWKPLWFEHRANPHTGREDWVSNGKFWDGDWQGSPDIF